MQTKVHHTLRVHFLFKWVAKLIQIRSYMKNTTICLTHNTKPHMISLNPVDAFSTPPRKSPACSMEACGSIGADLPEIPGLHLDPIVVGQSDMHWYLLGAGMGPTKNECHGEITTPKNYLVTCPVKRGHFKRQVVFQQLLFRDMLVLRIWVCRIIMPLQSLLAHNGRLLQTSVQQTWLWSHERKHPQS